jgi:uncharacterized protein (TIGR00297 family)
LVAAAIAFAAWRAHALSRSGALAAFIVGTLTFAYGGFGGALVLLGFFCTSTLLSRVGRARKRAIGELAKGGPRDAWQVLANGGVATIALLVGGPLGIAAFAGAYAAANADTWGTELGMLVRQPPYSILTGKPVGTGMSGGVTLIGTLAECAGAFLIAALAAVSWPSYGLFGAITLAGITGAFADSFLGATLQARRWCPACERECENDPHACGAPTQHLRGIPWIGNDAVNLAATATGALTAAALLVGRY